jgi:hypothetical protein
MTRISEKSCGHCGEVFSRDPRNTWAYWEKAKYCGQACAGLANSKRAEAERISKAEAFTKWVIKSDNGCCEWSGARDKDGYGIFSYAGISDRAAKVALELNGRPVPKGLYACHTCDNPPCVRTDHLYPGTPTQNMADAKERGRLNPRTKLTPDQVRDIRSATGTHDEIAAAFGVSRPNVSLIREGKTWRALL